MQNLLNFTEVINIKIAEHFFKQKIFLVYFYYCPDSGAPTIIGNYSFLNMIDGVKGAILTENNTLLEYLQEYNNDSFKDIINYQGYHGYFFKLIPNYIENSDELNKAITKIINTESLKNLYIEELKINSNSYHIFDLLNTSNFQKAVSLYNLLLNIE